ncbi:MAG: hypothetical protein ACK4GL_11740 [Flavobacteriales bacterium]
MVHQIIKGVFILMMAAIILPAFKSKEYKPSPLAKLMVQMNQEMRDYRQRVIDGKDIPDLEKRWKKMLTAEPTDASVKSEKFNAFATVFFERCADLKNAQVTDRKIAFNNMVSNCVTCHESFCPGPISMIKRLHIP